MKHILAELLTHYLSDKCTSSHKTAVLKTLISINHLPESENLNTRSLYGTIEISPENIIVCKIEKFYDSLANIKGKVTKETKFEFPGLNDIINGKQSMEEVVQMIDNFCDKLKEEHFNMGQFYIDGFSDSQLISYEDAIEVVSYVCANHDTAIELYCVNNIKHLLPGDFVVFTSEVCHLGTVTERLRFVCFNGRFKIVMEDNTSGKYEAEYYRNDEQKYDPVKEMIENAQLGKWEEFIHRNFVVQWFDSGLNRECVKAGTKYDLSSLYVKPINLKQVYNILKQCY